MANPVSICSSALVLLGDKPIASFTDNTDRAAMCAVLYPPARADLMRSHPWNCLIRRAKLAPMSVAPAFGWRQAFALPGDVLRIIAIGDDGEPEPYRVEGRTILANTKVLLLQYVADAPEAEWDASLVDLMTRRMARDLAYPITKSAALSEAKGAEYEAASRRARATDAQENPPDEWAESPFINVRG